jgi:nicotinamidase-related amidase
MSIRDLGVWTNEDSALVLIDYQKEQFESIRSETPADVIELHARWLARAAKAFDVPIVLSTSPSRWSKRSRPAMRRSS